MTISNSIAIKRKQEGILLLIRLLNEEMGVIKGGKPKRLNMEAMSNANVSLSDLEKIELWYKMMISFCSVSFLTLTAVYTYDLRYENLNKLIALNVFPLSYHERITISKKRIRLFNMFPRAMMWFIQMKNRFKS